MSFMENFGQGVAMTEEANTKVTLVCTGLLKYFQERNSYEGYTLCKGIIFLHSYYQSLKMNLYARYICVPASPIDFVFIATEKWQP